jgi:hypothetical protein
MPSKKKSKPSFNVPEDLQAAPQAGWVYRSDGEAAPAAKTAEKSEAAEAKAVAPPEPAPRAKKAPATAAPAPAMASGTPQNATEPKTVKPSPGKPKSAAKSDNGILGLAAKTLQSGFETVGNAVLLTTRIIAAPISMGMRLIGLKSK